MPRTFSALHLVRQTAPAPIAAHCHAQGGPPLSAPGPRSLRAELSEDGRVMDGTTGGALPAIHPSAAGQRRAVPFSRLCVMPRCVTLPLLVSTARSSSMASKHAWISGATLTSLPASIAATTGATRWRHWPSPYRAGWWAWFPAARRSARRGPTMAPIRATPLPCKQSRTAPGIIGEADIKLMHPRRMGHEHIKKFHLARSM